MLEFDVEKAVRHQKERALQQPQAEAAVTGPRFQQSPIHTAGTELNTYVIFEPCFYLHYFVNY